MNTVFQDLKFGFRVLAKNRGFTTIAVLTLALGIGATTSMFSVVNAIILRPLPYPDPEQLVGLGQNRVQKGMGYVQTGVSVPNILDIAARNHVFQQVSYYLWHSFNLTKTQPPQRLDGAQVSATLLPMFGVPPALGRYFAPDETQPGRGHVAVITYELWKDRLAANPGIIGKTLSLDDETYTVVGVLPQSFHFVWDSRMDVFVPLVLTPKDLAESARTTRNLQTTARMKPGITWKKAQAEMNEIALRLAQEHPDANRGWGIKVEPLHDAYHRRMDTALWSMLGAVCFVLLIACVNVANLSLARLSARRKELAVRLAVGASRVRLIGQLLTECLLLSALGGGLGIFLAYCGTKLLAWGCSRYFDSIPGIKELTLDWRVLIFTGAISLATGIAVGLAPAFKAAKSDVQDALKESAQSVSGAAGHKRLLNALVVVEMALAMVLLVGSGLLLRSFVKLVNVDLGFNPSHDLTFWMALPEYKYPQPAQQVTYFRQVLDQVASVPGVLHAGGMSMRGEFLFLPEGQPRPAPGQEPAAYEYMITPDYFQAAGASLVKGREFTLHDNEQSVPVAIINDTLARRYWRNTDPLGQHLNILSNVYGKQNEHEETFEVVGVVKNIKRYSVWEEIPEIFVPFEQHPDPYLWMEVRTAPKPLTLSAAVRDAAESVDKDQPVEELQAMDQVVAQRFGEIRFPMTLVWSFTSLALLLAAIGIYGVMSYSVSRRTHELAIRMAMGAERRALLKLVVFEGFVVTVTGVVVGTVAALIAGHVIATYLYGVSPSDPLTLLSMGVALVSVSLLACFLPALRAMRVDPMVALRYE
ncbi:MAG: ABC transporter permease [Terriglobia bacterium]